MLRVLLRARPNVSNDGQLNLKSIYLQLLQGVCLIVSSSYCWFMLVYGSIRTDKYFIN